VGKGHRIVLGKHSGSTAVIHAYKDLGMARRILSRVRSYAMAFKRPPGFRELMSYYLEGMQGSGRPAPRLHVV